MVNNEEKDKRSKKMKNREIDPSTRELENPVTEELEKTEIEQMDKNILNLNLDYNLGEKGTR